MYLMFRKYRGAPEKGKVYEEEARHVRCVSSSTAGCAADCAAGRAAGRTAVKQRIVPACECGASVQYYIFELGFQLWLHHRDYIRRGVFHRGNILRMDLNKSRWKT